MAFHNAVIVLSDGRYFFGRSLGSRVDCVGEVCFTTGFTGYQYTITDPSFAGQIVTFTFPHIGNVGINNKDFECGRALAKGIVVREVSCASHVSSHTDLNIWMEANCLTGIADVDTRAITRHLREHGTKIGVIHHFSDTGKVDIQGLQGIACAYKTRTLATELPHLVDHNVSAAGLRVCVIDLGAKRGIFSALTRLGCAVDVVAAQHDFAARALALKPRGIVISNGPGDPADLCPHAIDQLHILLDSGIPILGICLGHQLLAMALGAKTVKMHHGHRGSNHPVYNVETKAVEVTSQNHGYAVDEQTLPSNVEITHTSLFDGTVEGIRLTNRPVFSVQFHPEGCPGPTDSHYIFQDFTNLARSTFV
ncbi:glutamine-hydrolyzing carbamoyl-phosphate synthase small subunit [Candidatus Anaplasma sp. TIGMIC]|uniref:glutamine-hydrolyzing carbamoyl-phosphate synthase small subunit n=1 Tax=Candidatus Anaplasma sp. TIGMIC TaxID=3020713 RepID=UPI00232C8753|nr:glutamine-hydrolyzing carbamoyl-phosphate synthase small subunit [Candidatus Anaplasma sp. TIGMIC]MDB1134988.1 glutamine-hydrolyzing carbamoyl-phosphate synthase small subunit [Candidatus Anaplasma sp. TIGMIC]